MIHGWRTLWAIFITPLACARSAGEAALPKQLKNLDPEKQVFLKFATRVQARGT